MNTKSPFGAVPVFRPTLEEFTDVSSFVAKIWTTCLPCGLVKIIPPAGWSPTTKPYDTDSIQIPTPIKQVLNGKQGKFEQMHVEQPPMFVRDFKELAKKIRRRKSFRGPKYRRPRRKVLEVS
eukprot:TRINITY_DN1644_c0_g1_i3.p1 TRINITY_DN1644_c0_g1~~TRINITY_DN1644_c0_g1_i3.p1  ORF type:complete len:122 (-),score=19.76 TRINITY_DN1644_c0_g1_i3:174-539(-)